VGDHRQWKTTLAMTIIAVTAIICASTSEAARLVASFMQFSLDSGLGEPGFWTRFIVAREGPTTLDLLGTPLDEYSL
jgi:hypothetical protein